MNRIIKRCAILSMSIMHIKHFSVTVMYGKINKVIGTSDKTLWGLK